MDTGTCERCGAAFTPRTHGGGEPQRYCSPRCRWHAWRQRARERAALAPEPEWVTRLREAGLLMTEAEFADVVAEQFGGIMTGAEFAAMLPEWPPNCSTP